MEKNKNAGQDMTAKYKDEMMKQYRQSKTQTSGTQQVPGPAVPQTATQSARELSRPPMPEIPVAAPPQSQAAQAAQTVQAVQTARQNSSAGGTTASNPIPTYPPNVAARPEMPKPPPGTPAETPRPSQPQRPPQRPPQQPKPQPKPPMVHNPKPPVPGIVSPGQSTRPPAETGRPRPSAPSRPKPHQRPPQAPGRPRRNTLNTIGPIVEDIVDELVDIAITPVPVNDNFAVEVIPVMPRNTQPEYPTAQEILNADMYNSYGNTAQIPIRAVRDNDRDCCTSGTVYFEESGQYEGEEYSGGIVSGYSYEAEPAEDDLQDPDENNGFLAVEVTSEDGSEPICGANVVITELTNAGYCPVAILFTDSGGDTSLIGLDSTPNGLEEWSDKMAPHAEYYISVCADGYFPVRSLKVPIFPDVKSIQPITLVRLADKCC